MNTNKINFIKQLDFDDDLDEIVNYVFKVKYLITGKDHEGYCSGLETDEDLDYQENDNLKYEKHIININLSKDLFVTMLDNKEYVKKEYLKQLDYIDHGCTSKYGSGYCKGFGRKFNAIRAKFIE